MSNAEPKSTSTMSRDLENAASQPSPVAVSEENLAALMRATMSSAEPEPEHLAQDAPAAPVSNVNGPSSGTPPPPPDRTEAVTNPSANIVESRLALFAAVKENRSAISRSGLTPATPRLDPSPTENTKTTAPAAEHSVNIPASSPPKTAPLPSMLPEAVAPIPAPVSPIVTSSSLAISHDQSHTTSRTRLVIGLVMGAVIVTAGVSTFVMRTHSSTAPKVVPPVPKDNVPLVVASEPPLQVRIEPLGNGLIDVRWNPQSAPIAQARDGRLVITEHNQQPRTLALQAEQLKTGHLTYQSAAESVEFDLEIVDRSGSVTKESILALQAPASGPPPAKTISPTQPGNAATPTVQNVATLGVTTGAPPSSQPTSRTFIPPAAQHDTIQRALIDAPPALTNGPTIPLAVGLPAQPAAILPPPMDGPGEQQVRVESNIEAANLVKKVVPVYPQLARSAHIQGTVRFTAHIGKDGRILNLKFMSGPPVLVDSASTAVKQWIYRPTLLNGKPVEVITQIDVNFTLHDNTR